MKPAAAVTGGKVEIHDRRAMDVLKSEWLAASSVMEYETPFASWEWFKAWLETIGRSADVMICIYKSDAGETVIAPFATTMRGRRNTLAFGGSEHVYPDHLSLIGSESLQSVALSATLKELRNCNAGIRRLTIPMVVEGVALDRAMAPPPPGMVTRLSRSAVAPYLPIAESYEKFLAGLSSNERYKIRNRTKKMLAGSGVQYGPLPVANALEGLALLRDLHAKRASEKGIESSFDLPEIQAFHQALLGVYPAERVMFRGLFKGDEVLAAFYGFVVQRRVFYFQLGYDPTWSELSPGLVLLSEVIREAHEIGCAEFNFLQGDEPFKRTWTKRHRVLREWQLFPDDHRGRFEIQRMDISRRLRGFVRAAQKRLSSNQ